MKRFCVVTCALLLLLTVGAPCIAYRDLTNNDWYYDAVTWALNRGIAQPNNSSSFGAADQCTRATALMYLYNYSGDKTTASSAFTDVPKRASYAPAVAWGVSKGITNGTGVNTFSPNATTTRAQIITFIWRFAGQPKVSAHSVFSDVSSKDYFYDAVSWAVSLGITNGTSATTFSPNSTCTKAHIVTFLYRYYMSANALIEAPNIKLDLARVADGIVRVQWTGGTGARIKVQIVGPHTTYTYNIALANKWYQLPLSDGNGKYTVGFYKNISGTKYSTVYTNSFNVKLNSEFAPFLHSNQYVNYEEAPNTVAKAQKLCTGKSALDKISAVYQYAIGNLSYDYDLAKTVQSGYLPELDKVLQSRKGICFDYGALVAGMLRSQGVPCKLVIGYAGSQYHAWISAYTEESGWIEGAIYFNGRTWERLDPTFASTGSSSSKILQYISNDKNYEAKYYY